MTLTQLTIEDHSATETLSPAFFWSLLHAGDIAEAIVEVLCRPGVGVNEASVKAIHVPIKGAPTFYPPCWNILQQDLLEGYIHVSPPKSPFFLCRECDGGVIGLEKFQALAESPGVNHEREAFMSLFKHSLMGSLKYYDHEVYTSTQPVPGANEIDSATESKSQGQTLPEDVFFRIVRTKKYRIPTMPEALYLAVVMDWTNKAAAEKYNLTEDTVRKNRAQLVKDSGYESREELPYALGGSHEGKEALQFHAFDPVLKHGTNPLNYETGDKSE